MANILTAPLSGNIYFDDGSQDTTIPNLTGSAVSLGYDGCAGLTVTSYNTASGDRFTVAGECGSLFSVNDSLTGTIFSVNDASGLPIIEVNSDATTDTIAIGEFGTNALFVSAGNVGVGTNTPTSPLHVCGNIAVTGTVDGRDIASDGSKLDGVATGATSCTGTVTCIATSGGITGGPITGSGTLGINSTCNTKWDQSGCAGINCTGTTTASNTQTFTNKSGNISQWTNNSGYTTCTGDITCVGVGTGLTGGGASGNVSIAVITACDVSWSGAYTTAKALSACPGLNCTGTTTASNTQTFTNKSGNISQWTNNSGYTTCLGDITSVGAGNGLTGGGTCGGVTLNVGAGTAITVAADTVGVTTACNTAWNAKTTCTGTTTPSSTETFTNKSGNISQWTNDSGYTTCTGTGDITAVVAGNGLTGGATSGSATLNVGAGTAITVAADTVGVTTACNTAWNAKTTCTGTVTSVATGSGLTGGTITSSGTLSVDCTVARTNVNETFSCDVTINGDLTVNGDITCLETIVSTTSALSVVNHGSGPAITVNQAGSNDIVDFRDDNSSVFYIENGGFAGLNCTNPVQRLDVNGNINTSGDIRVDNNIVVNTGRCFTGVAVQPTTDIADAYIASAATWNAKTTCLGTVTCVNGGNGLTGAVTGSGSINVGSGTGICVIADAVCIATACNTAWNSAYTTTKALSGCAGLTCTGTISSVGAGTNLTGGGTCGSVTINMATGGVGAGTYGNTGDACKIDSITVDAYGRVTAVACGPTGSSCTNGTVTSVATGTGLTGGTITSSGTLSINSTCNTTWNSAYTTTKALSSCAGLTCVGDITSVGAGNGLTGGGSSGGVTLNVGAGTAITVAADTVGVTTACNTAWNAKTTCTGTVTSVATGSGLTGGTITSSGTLSVDSTVARTNVDETFSCDVTVVGTISASGTGFVDKLGIGAEPSGDEVLTVDGTNGNLFTITDSVTGTVFAVSDSAGLPILEAYTDACDMITMGEYGSNALVVCDTKVGVGTATPNEALTVVGSVSATCFKRAGGTSSQFLKADGSVDSTCYTSCGGTITSVGAGNGLTGGGSSGGVTICHCDTSSQGSVNNSNGTVIQDVTLDTFGHVTALGSTDLDGRYYTESEIQTFFNRSYISGENAVNLAVGWYTIATNIGNRSIARFGLRDTNSGDHQSVVFYAGHNYGTDASNTITVLHATHYGGSPLRYIRIKDNGTYDGAVLQIYIDDATNNVDAYILGDNFQSSGWVKKDWIPDATDPGDVSNYSSFTEKSKVDLDNIAQGGIATTGPIYADGDLTQTKLTSCTGTITCVAAGTGLTGGGASGCATLNVIGGDGITANADDIEVDCTVVRTSGAQTIAGVKTFSDDTLCIGGCIMHAGDSNTMIGFATDTMALCTGGENHICLTTSGVTINESGNANDFRVEGDTDTHLLFVDGSADNVGIGCSAPTQKLAVAGDGLFTSDLTVQGDLTVTGDFTCLDTTISVTSAMDITNHGTGPALCVNQTGSNDIVNFLDDGTSVFYIEDGGNVGIGTTSPEANLHILKDSVNGQAYERLIIDGDTQSTTAGGSSQAITFKGSGNVYAGAVGGYGNGTVGGIGVWGGSTNSGSPDVFVKSGNVGIGTTSPSAKLHVYQNDAATSTTAGITIEQDGTGDAQLQFLLSSAYRWVQGIDNSDGDKFKIGRGNAWSIGEDVTITTSGEVGIGTTSPAHKLEVGLTSSVALANQPAEPLFVSNDGNNVDGRVFISVKHDEVNTASAIGAGFKMTAAAVTSGTASYDDSLIFLNSAGSSNVTVHSAPRGIQFYVDNHDTNAGSGANYNDLGDLALTIGEDTNATFAGNIIVSGTVDGRDVAADGTKLDGIACGAEVNVQSDWNASSGDALILNKPTIPTNNNQLSNGCGYTCNTGTVTSVGGGDGLTGTVTISGNLAVDSTVVRTSGNQCISGLKCFASGITTGEVRTYNAQHLVLNAGESSSYATGQTNEFVYANAEGGLQINSSPDNWSSGWAGRKTTTINDTNGDSTFSRNIIVGGTVDGRDVAADGTKLDCIATGATSCTGNLCGCLAQCIYDSNNNFCIGANAGEDLTTGLANINLGECTGRYITTGSNNVAIGKYAGRCTGCDTKTSGDNNIYIGTDARAGAANSTNEMVFGNVAQGCGSNTIRMGNTSITAAYIQTAWSTTSDVRDKTCIADLDKGLCFIGDLQPKSYMWRCSRDSEETKGKCAYGFLAQDILALEDEGIIIDDNNPEHLSMKNDYLIPILVKGMQEQQAIIDNLTARLEALEG